MITQAEEKDLDSQVGKALGMLPGISTRFWSSSPEMPFRYFSPSTSTENARELIDKLVEFGFEIEMTRSNQRVKLRASKDMFVSYEVESESECVASCKVFLLAMAFLNQG